MTISSFPSVVSEGPSTRLDHCRGCAEVAHMFTPSSGTPLSRGSQMWPPTNSSATNLPTSVCSPSHAAYWKTRPISAVQYKMNRMRLADCCQKLGCGNRVRYAWCSVHTYSIFPVWTIWMLLPDSMLYCLCAYQQNLLDLSLKKIHQLCTAWKRQ